MSQCPFLVTHFNHSFTTLPVYLGFNNKNLHSATSFPSSSPRTLKRSTPPRPVPSLLHLPDPFIPRIHPSDPDDGERTGSRWKRQSLAPFVLSGYKRATNCGEASVSSSPDRNTRQRAPGGKRGIWNGADRVSRPRVTSFKKTSLRKSPLRLNLDWCLTATDCLFLVYLLLTPLYPK